MAKDCLQALFLYLKKTLHSAPRPWTA